MIYAKIKITDSAADTDIIDDFEDGWTNWDEADAADAPAQDTTHIKIGLSSIRLRNAGT